MAILKKKWATEKETDHTNWKYQLAKDLWEVFGGRRDVIAQHKKGKGYVPMGKKPNYQPATEAMVVQHLKGSIRLGSYALDKDHKCRWLAADFDDHDGNQFPLKDVKTYCSALNKKGIETYVLKSKSGNGYHVYLFLQDLTPAWMIRGVVEALIEKANLKKSSLDRLFPAQNTLVDKDRIGNLIAMPFQGEAVAKGNTIFLNPDMGYEKPYAEQNKILHSIKRLSTTTLVNLVDEFGVEEPEFQSEKGYDGEYSKDSLVKKVEEECPFIKHCNDHQRTLSEPEWHSMVSIVARCIDGEKAVHKFSENYPTYSRRETEDKIRTTLAGTGPHTCSHIESINDTYCKKCENKGVVSSPIQLGVEMTAGTLEKKGIIYEMNQKHAVIVIDGKTRVISEYYDKMTGRIDISYSTEKDFNLMYSDTTIVVRKKGRKTPIEMTHAQYWLQNSKRRFYRKEVFIPTDGVPPDQYNRFKGYTVKAKKGDWGLFRGHIRKILCSGDENLFDYMMHWMADAVQNIADIDNKPGVAIAIRGGQGTGKTTFGRAFCNLFDPYYYVITDSNRLTARFNNFLRESLVVFADEGFSVKGKRETAILKGLLTGRDVQVERKGLEASTTPNYSRVIFASNDRHIINMTGDDRRFFVIDISEERTRDREYFKAIHDQMYNQGGLAAMRYDLLKFNIVRDITDIPQTKAQIEQKEQSGDPIEQWWREKLEDGTNMPSFDADIGGHDKEPWKKEVLFKILHEDYKEWCRENYRSYTPMAGPNFSSRWRPMVPKELCTKRRMYHGNTKVICSFPGLQACRVAYELYMGVQPGTFWDSNRKHD